jgi:hypothetical protein
VNKYAEALIKAAAQAAKKEKDWDAAMENKHVQAKIDNHANRIEGWQQREDYAAFSDVKMQVVSVKKHESIWKVFPKPEDKMQPFYVSILDDVEPRYIKFIGKRDERWSSDLGKFLYGLRQNYPAWQAQVDHESKRQAHEKAYVAQYLEYLDDLSDWRDKVQVYMTERSERCNREMTIARLYYGSGNDEYYLVDLEAKSADGYYYEIENSASVSEVKVPGTVRIEIVKRNVPSVDEGVCWSYSHCHAYLPPEQWMNKGEWIKDLIDKHGHAPQEPIWGFDLFNADGENLKQVAQNKAQEIWASCYI